MIQDYEYHFLNSLLVDSSIKKLLLHCKKHNIKICAISNFYSVQQITKLQRANVLDLFDHIVTSEDIDIEKPNIKIFEYCIEKLQVDKKDILMIGDSEEDNTENIGIDYLPYNCNNTFIAISGKSGCGKTTLSSVLKKVFGSSILYGDNYHKYERKDPMWKKVTHYDVSANDLDLMYDHVNNLYFRNDILVSNYNHSSGKFDKKQIFKYNNNLILEGLHSFYNQEIKKFFKFSIFIENENSDNQKIKRDIRERNKKIDEILDSIKAREDDYKKYIEVQKSEANIILTVFENRIKILFSKSDFYKLENILINNGVYFYDDPDYIQLNMTYETLDEFKKNIEDVFIMLRENMYE